MDRGKEHLDISGRRKSKSRTTRRGLNPCTLELVDESENEEK